MTTGQKIKYFREANEMTQERLAELMGYAHKSSINKIEMGKSDLPQSKLAAFAKILHVKPCELLDDESGISTATQEELERFEQIHQSDVLADQVKVFDAVKKIWGEQAAELLHSFEQLNHNRTVLQIILMCYACYACYAYFLIL